MVQRIMKPEWFGVAVAALALVLSQLPPIRTMMRGDSVTVHVSESALVYQHFGNPTVMIDVSIANTGGSAVHLSKLRCAFVKGGAVVFSAPGQSVNDRSGSYSLGFVSIEPDDNWTGRVDFQSYAEEPLRSRALALDREIRKSIDRGVHEPLDLFGEAKVLTEEHLPPLAPGTYGFVLGVWSLSGEVLYSNAYELSVTAQDIDFLKSQSIEYRWIGGLGAVKQPQPVNLILRPVAEARAAQLVEVWESAGFRG